MIWLINRIKCFFWGHRVEFIGGSKLLILRKARCVDCGRFFCVNREEATMLPWDDSWDYEFEKMESLRLTAREGKEKE